MAADSQKSELADEYEKSIAAGRIFIRRNWSQFHQSSRDWFDKQSPEEIEQLEYELGTLARCADVNLPPRTDAAGEIAREALAREVPDVAGGMLAPERNQEPMFLRLALSAIRIHEMAWLQIRLPVIESPSTYALTTKLIAALSGGIATMIGIFSIPFMLGMGLVASQKGDAGDAIFWFYGIGITAFVYQWLKNINEKEKLSTDEIAFIGWAGLHGTGYGLRTGVGASVYLSQMLGKGVQVPLVALDLCAMLTERTTRKCTLTSQCSQSILP